MPVFGGALLGYCKSLMPLGNSCLGTNGTSCLGTICFTFDLG